MDWSALPLDVFLKIVRYQAPDFHSILAISGVCKAWRCHSSWINNLPVFWPPRGDLFDSGDRICHRHNAGLQLCTCLHDSLSMLISRLHQVRYLMLCSVNFLSQPALQVKKLRDSDWERLSGSLVDLDVDSIAGSRELGFITNCKKLKKLSITLDSEEDFSSEVGNRSLPLLQKLCIAIDLTQSSVGPLQKFLAVCPNAKQIEIMPRTYTDSQQQDVILEMPESIDDYDLTLYTYQLLQLKANRARGMTINAKMVVLFSSDCLESLVLHSSLLVFESTAEGMPNFWRLILTGCSWDMYQLNYACQTSPITKRVCLDHDFNVSYSWRDARGPPGSDDIECYALFSRMFQGVNVHVDEMELRYGFLRRMWLNEQRDGLNEILENMPKLKLLILELEVQPEDQLNIPRFADAVQSLVNCGAMEWISLRYSDDEDDDVNFHWDCFDKIMFSGVVENIITYGTPYGASSP